MKLFLIVQLLSVWNFKSCVVCQNVHSSCVPSLSFIVQVSILNYESPVTCHKRCISHYFSSGFGLGGAFGLFMSGLDSPVTTERMTARETLRDMGKKSKSYAKNFAIVGLMFAGSECMLESVSATLKMRDGGWGYKLAKFVIVNYFLVYIPV